MPTDLEQRTCIAHASDVSQGAQGRKTYGETAHLALALWMSAISVGYPPGRHAPSPDADQALLKLLKVPTSERVPLGSWKVSESTGLETANDSALGHASDLSRRRFFADSSPWNTKIPSDAGFTAIPDIGSYAAGFTSWLPHGGSIAIFFAHSGDPVVPVLANAKTESQVKRGEWRRTGNSAEVEEQIRASSTALNPFSVNPYSAQTDGPGWGRGSMGRSVEFEAYHQVQPLFMHVPPGAVPPFSSDGHTAIIQPDGMAVEMYSAIVLSTGEWVAEMFSLTPALAGQGVGRENGRTASMIENYAGALRGYEVRAGKIDHALAVVVPASMLTRSFTYPALAFDSNSNKYTGHLPMGGRLALPRESSITKLGLRTDFGRMLAQAAQEYGMFVVDQGGGGISIVTEARSTELALSTPSPSMRQDVEVIIHHIARVTAQ
jgi:hypothetical protein